MRALSCVCVCVCACLPTHASVSVWKRVCVCVCVCHGHQNKDDQSNAQVHNTLKEMTEEAHPHFSRKPSSEHACHVMPCHVLCVCFLPCPIVYSFTLSVLCFSMSVLAFSVLALFAAAFVFVLANAYLLP